MDPIESNSALKGAASTVFRGEVARTTLNVIFIGLLIIGSLFYGQSVKQLPMDVRIHAQSAVIPITGIVMQWTWTGVSMSMGFGIPWSRVGASSMSQQRTAASVS